MNSLHIINIKQFSQIGIYNIRKFLSFRCTLQACFINPLLTNVASQSVKNFIEVLRSFKPLEIPRGELLRSKP